MPSLPKNPIFGSAIQNKVPGGGVEEGEEVVDGGIREAEEETGLRKKGRCTPVFLMREPDRNRKGHTKDGYIAPRSGFRGKLRKGKVIEENDSFLYDPIEVPIDEAIRIVFHTDRNKFHLNLLLSAKDYLDARGIPTDGPALAAS